MVVRSPILWNFSRSLGSVAPASRCTAIFTDLCNHQWSNIPVGQVSLLHVM